MHIEKCLVSQLYFKSNSIIAFFKIKERYSEYAGLFAITASQLHINIDDKHSSLYKI